jgi:hypothetical protein
MAQCEMLSSLERKKWQTFGSLQQSPQPLHSPCRFLAMGKKAVNVRFIFASQVFRFL